MRVALSRKWLYLVWYNKIEDSFLYFFDTVCLVT